MWVAWGPSFPDGSLTKALAGTLIQGLSSSLCVAERQRWLRPYLGASVTLKKAFLRLGFGGKVEGQLEWALGWCWAGDALSLGPRLGAAISWPVLTTRLCSSEPTRHLLRQLSEKGKCGNIRFVSPGILGGVGG